MTSLLLLTITGLASVTTGYFLYRTRELKRELLLQEQQLERAHDENWELKSAAAALDKAEAASEAKSRFLATLSHEFRTPLNGILGLAELLGATSLTAEQSSYLSAIRASGDALSSLVNEILDFSRLEAGKIDLKHDEFDLPALVEGVVELLSPRAQGKGLEICSFVDKALPKFAVGDPGRLRQILINLIGNAVKFTEFGGVAVQASAPSEGLLRFSVLDTGPGVSRERRQLIFQEFEQGDGSSTRRYEGTGLGLAISRRIVEHMGGRLWLEKSDPKGSEFCFEFQMDPATPPGVRESSRCILDCSVLIAGEPSFANQFLARRLSDLGARTTFGANGQIRSPSDERRLWSPDFLLVDCSLGAELTSEWLTFARNFKNCKTILLFSPFERRSFGESMLKDFDGWLVKPVRLETIGSKLKFFGDRNQDTPVARTDGAQELLDLSEKTILLAEDNDVNALLVERQLTKLGANVLRARDGAEAVKIFEESLDICGTRIDLVLMDIRMPRLDGLAAARGIRSIEAERSLKGMPIIALTANAFDDDREAAAAAGMQGFLTKPVTLSTLLSALTSLKIDD